MSDLLTLLVLKKGLVAMNGQQKKIGNVGQPQFYIQLVNRPHFGTGILLFWPFGQSGQ